MHLDAYFYYLLYLAVKLGLCFGIEIVAIETPDIISIHSRNAFRNSPAERNICIECKNTFNKKIYTLSNFNGNQSVQTDRDYYDHAICWNCLEKLILENTLFTYRCKLCGKVLSYRKLVEYTISYMLNENKIIKSLGKDELSVYFSIKQKTNIFVLLSKLIDVFSLYTFIFSMKILELEKIEEISNFCKWYLILTIPADNYSVGKFYKYLEDMIIVLKIVSGKDKEHSSSTVEETQRRYIPYARSLNFPVWESADESYDKYIDNIRRKINDDTLKQYKVMGMFTAYTFSLLDTESISILEHSLQQTIRPVEIMKYLAPVINGMIYVNNADVIRRHITNFRCGISDIGENQEFVLCEAIRNAAISRQRNLDVVFLEYVSHKQFNIDRFLHFIRINEDLCSLRNMEPNRSADMLDTVLRKILKYSEKNDVTYFRTLVFEQISQLQEMIDSYPRIKIVLLKIKNKIIRNEFTSRNEDRIYEYAAKKYNEIAEHRKFTSFGCLFSYFLGRQGGENTLKFFKQFYTALSPPLTMPETTLRATPEEKYFYLLEMVQYGLIKARDSEIMIRSFLATDELRLQYLKAIIFYLVRSLIDYSIKPISDINKAECSNFEEPMEIEIVEPTGAADGGVNKEGNDDDAIEIDENDENTDLFNKIRPLAENYKRLFEKFEDIIKNVINKEENTDALLIFAFTCYYNEFIGTYAHNLKKFRVEFKSLVIETNAYSKMFKVLCDDYLSSKKETKYHIDLDTVFSYHVFSVLNDETFPEKTRNKLVPKILSQIVRLKRGMDYTYNVYFGSDPAYHEIVMKFYNENSIDYTTETDLDFQN